MSRVLPGLHSPPPGEDHNFLATRHLASVSMQAHRHTLLWCSALNDGVLVVPLLMHLPPPARRRLLPRAAELRPELHSLVLVTKERVKDWAGLAGEGGEEEVRQDAVACARDLPRLLPHWGREVVWLGDKLSPRLPAGPHMEVPLPILALASREGRARGISTPLPNSRRSETAGCGHRHTALSHGEEEFL